ncbi:ATP-binding protein, partial [Streptomyces triticagri]
MEIPLPAVTAMVSAMGTGMATEAGRQLMQLVGGLAGRDGRAPDSGADWGPLAQVLCDHAREDPEIALRLAHIMAMTRSTLTPLAIARTPQLPPTTQYFENRRPQLRTLVRGAGRRPGPHPRRAMVHGEPGAGTTALALRFGWSEAQRFPDGQLYVDLRHDTDPNRALRDALRQLGVDERRIPVGALQRRDTFQELVAGRRILVVLDQVRSVAQIRPLLAASPSVFTVVVGHRPLAGLDAERVEVTPLTQRHALRLLTRVAGKEAVDALGRAVDGELARCGGRPGAVRL